MLIRSRLVQGAAEARTAMNARSTVRMIGLALAAAAALGATVVRVAQSTSPRVTSVPVCVKTNGQVRVLVGGTATCDSSEQRTDWVVGGEVTDIALGQGLIGTRDGGTIQLAIDPTLLQRGRIFSGFNDGPAPIPLHDPSGVPSIAQLALPAGDFAIFAKLTITNDLDDTAFSLADDHLHCELIALPDFDSARLVLPDKVSTGLGQYAHAAVITLQLVHHFSTPGSVTLTCREIDDVSPDPDLSFQDLKITAIEASNISNVFLPVP
jgi:hypothetical protein